MDKQIYNSLIEIWIYLFGFALGLLFAIIVVTINSWPK
jgi:uncharacterized membrane protein YgaE (UPF0421/DUF939 family)